MAYKRLKSEIVKHASNVLSVSGRQQVNLMSVYNREYQDSEIFPD